MQLGATTGDSHVYDSLATGWQRSSCFESLGTARPVSSLSFRTTCIKLLRMSTVQCAVSSCPIQLKGVFSKNSSVDSFVASDSKLPAGWNIHGQRYTSGKSR